MKSCLGAVAVSLLLSVAAARAQDSASAVPGHVMGAVTAIRNGELTIETNSGSVTVLRTEDTRYESMNTPVAASELRVGDRVMIDVSKRDGRLTARTVRIKANARVPSLP